MSKEFEATIGGATRKDLLALKKLLGDAKVAPVAGGIHDPFSNTASPFWQHL